MAIRNECIECHEPCSHCQQYFRDPCYTIWWCDACVRTTFRPSLHVGLFTDDRYIRNRDRIAVSLRARRGQLLHCQAACVVYMEAFDTAVAKLSSS